MLLIGTFTNFHLSYTFVEHTIPLQHPLPHQSHLGICLKSELNAHQHFFNMKHTELSDKGTIHIHPSLLQHQQTKTLEGTIHIIAKLDLPRAYNHPAKSTSTSKSPGHLPQIRIKCCHVTSTFLPHETHQTFPQEYYPYP